MKWLPYRLLLVLPAWLLTSCSLTADTAETWDDYSLNDEARSFTAVRQDDPGQIYTQWTTRPVGDGTTLIIWGSPSTSSTNDVEEMQVRLNCSADGRSWVYLNSLGTHEHRFTVHTTRARYLTEAESFDLTNNGCGREGQPYALYEVNDSPYLMQVWGWIAHLDGSKSHDFFWQQEVLPGQTVTNPCWQGEGESTRKALRLREAWWDTRGGWIIGEGELDENGQPTGQAVVYGRERIFAKDAGRLWQYRNFQNGDRACLQDSEAAAPLPATANPQAAQESAAGSAPAQDNHPAPTLRP